MKINLSGSLILISGIILFLIGISLMVSADLAGIGHDTGYGVTGIGGLAGGYFTGNGSSASNALLTEGGNVGIGTLTPSVPLEVNGTINASQILVNGTPVSFGGIDWQIAYNGTLFKTDASNTVGDFNQTFGIDLFFLNANNNFVGIGTNTPNATLNLYGNNSGVNPSLIVGGDPGGDSDFWIARYKNNDAINNDVFQIGNGTAPGQNVIWTINMTSPPFRIGVGTVNPQNTFNIIGDLNATASIFAQSTKNLSIGYDYATNNTFLTSESLWNGNYSNFSNIYAMEYNGSLITGTNATYGYSLNNTLWSLNYSNFSVVYGYALNTSSFNYSNIVSNQTFNSTFGYFNVTNQTGNILVVNNSGVFINSTLNVVGKANITQNLTIGIPTATAYIQFARSGAAALATCGAAYNATLAANNTGLWWCNGTRWARIGPG